MNEIKVKEKVKVENLIYEVRGKQVMLDSDLAWLYECANGTKTINLAVKRHINRFPERFMFQLTKEESEIIRFQIETKNKNIETRGGKFSNPHVFTEQGVAMLATVLRTKVAEEVSIRIMDAFVLMRHYVSNNEFRISNIETKIIEHENNIKLLQESFDKFEEKKKVNEIFFEGQIYDAYSLLLDILKDAKEEIIIIDNYAGKELLDILKKFDINIKIYSKNIDEILIKKYKSQYSNVKWIASDKFHDRFIICDNKNIYHCGSSLKDLGKKCFAINKIESENILNSILQEINI